MKIPQFLYVPKINTLGHDKIIIETRHNIYWQVLDFGSITERSQYIDDNQDLMSDWGMLSANIHTKYPILLMCFRCDAELKAEQLVKIGNRACDWYVQPSRYEGKSIVVREAQILQKPVIVTAYPTASSQINHLQDGVIVPLELQSCANEMAKVLKNDDLKQRLIAYLQAHDFANESEVNKIYAAMNA